MKTYRVRPKVLRPAKTGGALLNQTPRRAPPFSKAIGARGHRGFMRSPGFGHSIGRPAKWPTDGASAALVLLRHLAAATASGRFLARVH